MAQFAFVFPGQGSQAVGMLDAWGDHPAVTGALQEASDALGEDLGRLIKEGPKETLGLTTNTQPVMLVAGVAAYRAWLAEGGAAPARPAAGPDAPEGQRAERHGGAHPAGGDGRRVSWHCFRNLECKQCKAPTSSTDPVVPGESLQA